MAKETAYGLGETTWQEMVAAVGKRKERLAAFAKINEILEKMND